MVRGSLLLVRCDEEDQKGGVLNREKRKGRGGGAIQEGEMELTAREIKGTLCMCTEDTNVHFLS